MAYYKSFFQKKEYKLLPLEFEKSELEDSDRLYEPDKDALVNSLIPRHLNIQVWK